MLRYFHGVTDTGYCVAYEGLNGPVVVFECNSRDRAMREAARYNLEQQQIIARAAQRKAENIARKRRGIRYFEPDQFE